MVKTIAVTLMMLGGLVAPAGAGLKTGLVLHAPQTVTAFGSGFYPFSDSANAEFQTLRRQNRNVGIWITGLGGGSFQLAPAADNHEIGKKRRITADTTLVLPFKKRGTLFGLSIVPSGSPTFTVMLQPFAGAPCPQLTICQVGCPATLGACCKADGNGNTAKICLQGKKDPSTCRCAKK